MANKTEVSYNMHDPNKKGVTYVSIQTGSNRHYVWCTYSTKDASRLPKLSPDLLMVPIDAAKKLFEFKKGSLEEKSV
jgi:hypothetical protein